MAMTELLALFRTISHILTIYLACFWSIIKRQQAVSAESEREHWLLRVGFHMSSTRHHLSGSAALRWVGLARAVPNPIRKNCIGKFIYRVVPQRFKYSPWIRNFLTFRCDRASTEARS
jgi:hypothetical protein